MRSMCADLGRVPNRMQIPTEPGPGLRQSRTQPASVSGNESGISGLHNRIVLWPLLCLEFGIHMVVCRQCEI